MGSDHNWDHSNGGGPSTTPARAGVLIFSSALEDSMADLTDIGVAKEDVREIGRLPPALLDDKESGLRICQR